MSKIFKAVYETARDLRKAGVMNEVTMREFDALCLPPVKRYGPKDIRRIRRQNKVSQSVFAAFMNVGKTTVQQWEQGLKRPHGASLKLLDVVDRKGIKALM